MAKTLTATFAAATLVATPFLTRAEPVMAPIPPGSPAHNFIMNYAPAYNPAVIATCMVRSDASGNTALAGNLKCYRQTAGSAMPLDVEQAAMGATSQNILEAFADVSLRDAIEVCFKKTAKGICPKDAVKIVSSSVHVRKYESGRVEIYYMGGTGTLVPGSDVPTFARNLESYPVMELTKDQKEAAAYMMQSVRDAVPPAPKPQTQTITIKIPTAN